MFLFLSVRDKAVSLFLRSSARAAHSRQVITPSRAARALKSSVTGRAEDKNESAVPPRRPSLHSPPLCLRNLTSKASSTLCRAAHLQLLVPQPGESCTIIQRRLEVRLLDGSPPAAMAMKVRSETCGFDSDRQDAKEKQTTTTTSRVVQFQLVTDWKMCVSQWEDLKFET